MPGVELNRGLRYSFSPSKGDSLEHSWAEGGSRGWLKRQIPRTRPTEHMRRNSWWNVVQDRWQDEKKAFQAGRAEWTGILAEKSTLFREENKETPRWDQEHTPSRASCPLGVAHGSPPTQRRVHAQTRHPLEPLPGPGWPYALFLLLLFQHPFWFHSQTHPVRDNKFYGHPTQTPLYATSVLRLCCLPTSTRTLFFPLWEEGT